MKTTDNVSLTTFTFLRKCIVSNGQVLLPLKVITCDPWLHTMTIYMSNASVKDVFVLSGESLCLMIVHSEAVKTGLSQIQHFAHAWCLYLIITTVP